MPVEELLEDALTVNLERVVTKAQSLSMCFDRSVNSKVITTEFLSSYEWLTSTQRRVPFSFIWLCNYFELDADTVKERFLKENGIVDEIYQQLDSHVINEEQVEQFNYKLNMTREELSEKIIKYRKETGKTLETLSVEFGASKKSIYNWMHKIRFPRNRVYIVKMAKVLEIEDKISKVPRRKILRGG